MSVFVIAEAGVNHNGSLDLAKQLVDVASQSGADAVKFQTFKTSALVSRAAQKARYQKLSSSAEETQYEMLRKLELSAEDHHVLLAHCKKAGIEFMSSPFDEGSLALLVSDEINVRRIKLGSGEITNAPLLLAAAGTKRPVILSTGMCTLAEIEVALGVLAFGYLDSGEKPRIAAFESAYLSNEGRRELFQKVTLLHCTSEYPAPFSDVNLRAMKTIQNAFGLPVGFSDHTPGISVPLAAVALGAKVIEKHFTLDKSLPGPDHRASLNPSELQEMVKGIREVGQALGSQIKLPSKEELENRGAARKSLTASHSIKKGELFTTSNLLVKRPGTGLSPMLYWDWLGKPSPLDLAEDETFRHD